MLDVPDDVAVVEMTPLGYPEGEPKTSSRKDLAEIVFYESYGKTSH